MSRLPGWSDVVKNLKKRVKLWLLVGIGLVLLDEYVKEGYWFCIDDVFVPLTHENLLLIMVLVIVCMICGEIRRFG